MLAVSLYRLLAPWAPNVINCPDDALKLAQYWELLMQPIQSKQQAETSAVGSGGSAPKRKRSPTEYGVRSPWGELLHAASSDNLVAFERAAAVAVHSLVADWPW